MGGGEGRGLVFVWGLFWAGLGFGEVYIFRWDVFVLFVFLNKAFIAASAGVSSTVPRRYGRVTFGTMTFLMYECTTGHPTLLSICIIMTVVTYSSFSRPGGTDDLGVGGEG